MAHGPVARLLDMPRSSSPAGIAGLEALIALTATWVARAIELLEARTDLVERQQAVSEPFVAALRGASISSASRPTTART